MKIERTIAFVLLIASLLVIIPLNDHRSVMLNSMMVQISMGVFMLGVLALIGRRVQVFMACMIAGGLMSWSIPDFSNHKYAAKSSTDTLKVVHFNVLKLNHDHQTIINAVRAENPDVVSFQEVTHEWDKALDRGLSAQYPYHVNYPNAGSFGISFYSKYPLQDTSICNFEGIPFIKGTIQKDGTDIAFIASHTMAPTTENYLALRNRLVNEIGSEMAQVKTQKLIIGDMNAVPWDRAIKHLQKNCQLRDSRNSLEPTFPSSVGMLRIPIDYIFYGGGLTCKNFKVLSHSSSDHLGIAGEYVL